MADAGASAAGGGYPAMPPAPPLDGWQRLLFRLLLAVLWVARHLPDRPLYRAGYAVGGGLYLLMPGRREPLRSNLRRVCGWLVEQDMAIPRVARAATDDRVLERMVRATFGHWVVGYVEAALGPGYSAAELRERIVASDPATSLEALMERAPGQVGPIHMAMHFGSVDLSGLYGTRVGRVPVTGPMEAVEHPLARAYFDHVRGEMGITLVPIDGAAPSLLAAVERGEAAGVVADRNIRGRGSEVQLFGAGARLPVGPAVLSVQSGATIYLQAIERVRLGSWIGHTIAIRHDPAAKRKEAVRSILEQEARAFERLVARAPEQWTTLFYPIWSDQEAT